MSDKHLKKETMMRVWERNNYLLPLWKKSTSGVWKCFLLTCPLQTWLTAIRRCCRLMLNHIYCWTWFCSLTGTVTKTRTLAQPSCHIRSLSNFKPACLIYLYSFVCSATRRTPSFVEDWLCYAHGCTFLALLSMPSPKSLAWHLIEAYNYQEK